MTFSENTNLTPGGQSASPSKVKELENRIDDLQQTVTSVADSVADLADEVNTHELNADEADITNAVIDNATVGTETATTVNADTVNADALNATDASVTNLTADDIEANTVDADNGYFGSANAQSFTGQGVNITGDITASNKVQGKTVQATEKVVTPALESTQTELKGATTVRGDVYFPEDGDKIYGEYLEIEADKVKADIEAETVSVTSVTAGAVTATGVASQSLFVTGNSRFMGEVQARDIVPEPGQTLDITTDTLDADSIEADTVKVNSLTTETPTGSSQLVGYDSNGNLIPVDAGLDPANYFELVPGDQTTIQPKDGKGIKVTDLEVSGDTTLEDVSAENATVSGDIDVSGDTTLADTEVDGTLTVNGDIVQNGSAYETHAEKLYTKKDLIITRDGAVSGLSTGEYTGIQAKKYDGTNDGQLVFDKDGEARVGDIGDTQPILTRDEIANMTNGSLLKWDGTNKKAVCAQSVYIETTWAALKTLRDGGHLVKGMQYRITDYVTTTTQPETQSAGHAFDIIVTADSESVLNENARAAIHTGDTYFSDSKLQAWKLKYCLDNDTYRFAWADSTNGKGVIYQMIDEFENDLPYDFKNIQFKRYKITAKTTATKPDSLVNGYYGARSSQNPASTTGQLNPQGYTISTADTVFRFTFDYNGADYSLNKYSTKSGSEWVKNCYGNEIAPYYYNQKQGLNNVVFLNTSNGAGNSRNKLTGARTYSNTFGNDCYSNTFGNSCSSNTFGNSCSSNTFGNSCSSNTFGNSCYYNTFGNSCSSNTFGNSCSYNTFGNSCSSNTFGNSCYYNTFAIPDGVKNFKMDSVFYFDDEDSSDYNLQFINNGNSSVTVTGIYFVGEFDDKDTQPPTSVNRTVPAGSTVQIFSYDDGDYEDGYSYWSLSATINGRVVNNAGDND
ncbi:MAG: polymer-forming cytoskeletal protein [Methanobrevibacter sp.]|nr:polymer-forming cytoskeletal protein [Methanobrevibacter sp.]